MPFDVKPPKQPSDSGYKGFPLVLNLCQQNALQMETDDRAHQLLRRAQQLREQLQADARNPSTSACQSAATTLVAPTMVAAPANERPDPVIQSLQSLCTVHPVALPCKHLSSWPDNLAQLLWKRTVSRHLLQIFQLKL
eukprot:s94_g58.t1